MVIIRRQPAAVYTVMWIHKVYYTVYEGYLGIFNRWRLARLGLGFLALIILFYEDFIQLSRSFMSFRISYKPHYPVQHRERRQRLCVPGPYLKPE
jgi:hypothetical protein